MRFFAFLSVLTLAFCLPFAQTVSEAQSDLPGRKRNAVNMNEIFSAQGKKGDIEYRITGTLQKKGVYANIDYPNDNIVVEYELKNTGAKTFVVYDQGHSNDNGGFAYVEPIAGGAVEISLKAFAEPQDKNCPARFAAILPRGNLLRSGEIIKDRVYVELPLTAKTPFDDCEPQARLALNAARVKFCIGFQEAAIEKTKDDALDRISPLSDFKNQQLICTEFGEIK